MRDHAYWLFALVAWPAAAWGCFETALRIATGYTAGVLPLLALTTCAAGTIAASRWRRLQLPIR